LQRTSNTIVLVCVSCELAEAQRKILEEHGYQVLVARDLRELDRISRNTPLACAVLGEDIGDSMKHAISTLLCDNLHAVAILEEYTTSPALADAEHVRAGEPSDLLAAIDDLLLPYGQRHTAHIQRKARIVMERVRQARETAKCMVQQARQIRAFWRRSRNKKKNEQSAA
jgi:hexokinase